MKLRGRVALFSAALLVASTACDPTEVTKDVVEQLPAEAPAETPPEEPPPPPEPVELTAQKEGSHVEFFVAKATGGHRVDFETFTARARFSGERLDWIRLDLEVDSLRSEHAAFARDVKAEIFLDVAHYPKSYFESTKVDGEPALVTGTLNLRGVDKEIQFVPRFEEKEGLRVADAEITLALKDFGIVHPLLEAEMVDDHVELRVHLEFKTN